MTTNVPTPIVTPSTQAWQTVDAAYAQVRAAQLEHGDLSLQARIARRQASLAWASFEARAYTGRPGKPVVLSCPFMGETRVSLPLDVAGVGYSVCIAFDADLADVAVLPEPVSVAGVTRVLRHTLDRLDALRLAAVFRQRALSEALEATKSSARRRDWLVPLVTFWLDSDQIACSYTEPRRTCTLS